MQVFNPWAVPNMPVVVYATAPQVPSCVMCSWAGAPCASMTRKPIARNVRYSISISPYPGSHYGPLPSSCYTMSAGRYNKVMSEYTLKRSRRARTMRLAVHPGGSVVVTAPERVSESVIARFVEKNLAWIESAVVRMRDRKELPVRGRKAYLKYKEEARRKISARVLGWCNAYGLSYGRIAIKDTTSLWGSCSRRGNLNFSYKLIFLPEELQEYVVVHEVCHLREPNHSRAFWGLVETSLPNYRRLRSDLQKYLLR